MNEIYNEFTIWLEKNFINLDEADISLYCFTYMKMIHRIMCS
ncbi:hypothetical protein [Acidaminobacter sp. JC074]|nr:hypothetical protein [Acidaminobacter sp. JC074]